MPTMSFENKGEEIQKKAGEIYATRARPSRRRCEVCSV